MLWQKYKSLWFQLVEDGSVSGICHKLSDEEHIEVVTKAMSRGAFVNPLNPEVFPGAAKMEAEVKQRSFATRQYNIHKYN